ncbi:Ppx-GppA-domain-containing protein [Aureobasidium namibiae CBS 147.97]|uniref:Ppx-GppA-domain-containing protein n=1 Tax=Aureobasidium namibiae CBS 147.97 TaxID=1043004 RepID=A0A074WI24_9PEZI
MGGGQEIPHRHNATTHKLISEPQWNTGLWGLVDMGSNGIRLSITDQSAPTTRVLPTVYAYRNKISLYEAQYDDNGTKVPISAAVMDDVVSMLLRFQIFCADFRVPPEQIEIVATEATRAAINSKEFCDKIRKETGLKMTLLSKEDEGRIGAYGVASSFSAVRGLVMDMGGGSTQITWMIANKGETKISPVSAVSFPYGAAALTRRLEELKKGKSKHEAHKAREEFRAQVTEQFKEAYGKIQVPHELVKDATENGGFRLYLTGGGFRGWGYLLLHHEQVAGGGYPFSIINGFTAQKDEFEDTEKMKQIAEEAKEIFRVSDRRRGQVPAVSFLVSILAKAIPHGIREAHFCQGGVREGVLYNRLHPGIRAQDPLEVATRDMAKPISPKIAVLVTQSLPQNAGKGFSMVPGSIDIHMIRAFANMFYFHANMNKEVSSTSALYSTGTGILCSTHGSSHADRALLALMLEARYEGELAPRETSYRDQLIRLVSNEEAWWTQYIGVIGLILSRAFPAGVIQDDLYDFNTQTVLAKPEIKIQSEYVDTLGKSGKKSGLMVTFTLVWKTENRSDPMEVKETLERHIKDLVKVGKKKHAINGWRIKVGAKVVDDYPNDM